MVSFKINPNTLTENLSKSIAACKSSAYSLAQDSYIQAHLYISLDPNGLEVTNAKTLDEINSSCDFLSQSIETFLKKHSDSNLTNFTFNKGELEDFYGKTNELCIKKATALSESLFTAVREMTSDSTIPTNENDFFDLQIKSTCESFDNIKYYLTGAVDAIESM